MFEGSKTYAAISKGMAALDAGGEFFAQWAAEDSELVWC